MRIAKSVRSRGRSNEADGAGYFIDAKGPIMSRWKDRIESYWSGEWKRQDADQRSQEEDDIIRRGLIKGREREAEAIRAACRDDLDREKYGV